jgi:polysaccharide biosynthesis transport protein
LQPFGAPDPQCGAAAGLSANLGACRVLQAIAGRRREPDAESELAVPASRERAAAGAPEEPAAFVSPERVLEFIRRQKWTLAVVVAISLLLGLAFVALSPPKYRSMVRFLVDPRGLEILKNDITRTSDSADSNLLDVENQRYVILSRSILTATVKRGDLADSPLFGNAPPGLLGRLFALLGRPPALLDREDKAINALADAVDVVRGERAYILDIVVTTRDPKVSADIANLIAKVYLEQQQEGKNQTSKRASDALNGRAEELAHEVQQAEEDVESFRLRNNLAIGATGQLLGDQQVSDLNTQLSLAKARTAAAQGRVEQLEQMTKSKLDPAQLPEAMQSPVITSLRAQYAQLIQQEASYVTQFGPKHPALLQVRGQIQDVRNLIAAEVTRTAQSARSDLNRAKASEAALIRSMDQVRQGLGDNSVALAHLHELERAADAKKSIYQSVLSRQKELEEQQGIDTSNTRIISDAVPATKPSGPPAIIVLAGALIFGLGAGAGAGFLRETMSAGVMTRDDLENLLGAPLLGRFTGQAPKPRRKDEAAGVKTQDRENASAILEFFCANDEAPWIVGLVGLHNDDMRAKMLAEFSAAAEGEHLLLGLLDCDSGGPLVTGRSEPKQDAKARRMRAEPEKASITPLADLLLHDPGPLTLRHLRSKLRDYATRKDLVFVNMPAVDDVGMPPVLLEAVEAVVLVIADGDATRKSIERLVTFVGRTKTPVTGFILTGKQNLS